jgi:hypothetical protein
MTRRSLFAGDAVGSNPYQDRDRASPASGPLPF